MQLNLVFVVMYLISLNDLLAAAIVHSTLLFRKRTADVYINHKCS